MKPLDLDFFTKRIRNIDDFAKLFGELKSINRGLKEDSSKDAEQLKEMKKMVEDRLEELMYISLV